jgi:hypothetical protein
MPGANVPRSDRDLPVNIDRTKASVARVYDAALGGKDNYEIDREVIRRLQQVAPEISRLPGTTGTS